MSAAILLLNTAPAANKLQLLLFPIIPALLGVLLLIVICVIGYLLKKQNQLNLK
jgi:hypothetical protein